MPWNWLTISFVAAGMLTGWLSGCTVPEPPILHSPRMGVHYDTDYEKQARDGKWDRPLLDGIWEPYFETLAEPVAVTRATKTHLTWQILYATNRGQLPGGENAQRDHYGNTVLETPTFGTSEIEIPWRLRGKDPQTSPGRFRLAARAKSLLAGSGGNELRTESLAVIRRVSDIPSSEFHRELTGRIEQSRQKDVLLFVHGFNVSFDASLIRTAQLGMDIPFNGAIIAYSWPTQGGVLKYESDEPVNESSVVPFTQFLAWLVHTLPPESRLNILVHSMGNRIVLKAVSQLPKTRGETKPVAALCLCAPDVGVSDYQDVIGLVVDRCQRVVLYTNESDGALTLSKSLHLERRLGDAEVPAVAGGVELIDCSKVDLSLLGHSYFSGNISILSDLFRVLKENKQPAECHYLQQETTATGEEYWSFREHPNYLTVDWHFDRLGDTKPGSD